jgi:hypothetical protein
MHEVIAAHLTTGAVIAVVEREGGLAIADPDTDGAFALQLDRPAREMFQMIRRRGRRHNVKVWRCYGRVSNRAAAVSIFADTPTVWAAQSLHDWPVPVLVGSPA